jgi:transposase
VRDIVDVQKQVAITLYWLVSSAEYRTIGNLFGVGRSTVYSIVHKVCEAIYEDLLNVYVKLPTQSTGHRQMSQTSP